MNHSESSEHLIYQVQLSNSIGYCMKTNKLLRVLKPIEEEIVDDRAECRLLVGLIERACRDLRDPRSHIRLEASAWIRSDSTDPWSFLWSCSHLATTQDTIDKIRDLTTKSLPEIRKILDIRNYTRARTSASSFTYLF